jgi:hypothetical protein
MAEEPVMQRALLAVEAGHVKILMIASDLSRKAIS